MIHLSVVAEVVGIVAQSVGFHRMTFRRGVPIGAVQFAGYVLDLIDRLRFVKVR